MKKSVAETWIKELRSGRWEQGRDALCSVDTQNGKKCYCCLGVLTELYNVNRIKQRKKQLATKEILNRPNDGLDVISYESDGLSYEQDSLPTEVRKWAGMETGIGCLTGVNEPEDYDLDFESLADMNDSGKSFKYIADFIEEYYEYL